jgi:flagellar assembly protein FliH
LFRIERDKINLSAGDAVRVASGTEEASWENEERDRERDRELEALREKIISEGRAESEGLIKKARLEAERLERAAAAEAEELREAARRDGYQDGYNEGKASAEDALSVQLKEGKESIDSLISEALSSRDRLLDGMEGEIIDLVLAVAKKIVNVAIKNDDTIFEEMIKKALKQMKWEGKLTIRVNSAEYERFFPSGSARFVLGDETVTAAVIDDPSIEGGGCIVESDGEMINCGADSQLRFITLAFGRSVEKL